MCAQLDTLQEWINDTGNIVAYTGQGVSAASGVPDFLQMEQGYGDTYRQPPAAIWSRHFLQTKPALVFQF